MHHIFFHFRTHQNKSKGGDPSIFVRDLREACCTSGFFDIVGHDISEQLHLSFKKSVDHNNIDALTGNANFIGTRVRVEIRTSLSRA